jgi:hypothetical protein
MKRSAPQIRRPHLKRDHALDVVANATVGPDQPLVRVGENRVPRTKLEEQRSPADERFEVPTERPRRVCEQIGEKLALAADPLEERPAGRGGRLFEQLPSLHIEVTAGAAAGGQLRCVPTPS